MKAGAAALLLLLAQVAHACPTCAAGDPALALTGTEPLYRGRLRVSFEVRYARAEHGGEEIDEGVARGTISYAPLEWLAIFAAAPLVLRDVRSPDGMRAGVFGPGDAELGARAELMRDRSFAPTHRFGASTSLLLPTSIDQVDPQGALLPLDAQTGRGSIAPSFGLWSMHSFDPWTLFATWSARVPFAPRWAERGGPSMSASLALHWRALDRLTLRAAWEMRWELAGVRGDRPDLEAGGVALWVGPGVLLSLSDDVVVALQGRAPLWVSGMMEGWSATLWVMIDA